MPFVIGSETFEKLGSIGTAANLMVYLTGVFHMPALDAAVALNLFSGTTNLATVAGAFVSDLFLGRFSTLSVASPCDVINGGGGGGDVTKCVGATREQTAVLGLSFALIVLGAGGIRPCSMPFGADQFDPSTESGRRGIDSFFKWYYLTLTAAVCLSSTEIVYVQTNFSWLAGFAIPAALMLLSCILFFSGADVYVRVQPHGSSPFVAVAAFRNRLIPSCSSSSAAAEKTLFGGGTARNPWRICSVEEVEETKCIIRILPVWATCILYYVAFAQTNTYVILQAAQSDRRLVGFGVPAGTFAVFPMVALAVWIPIYDRLVVPWTRRRWGRPVTMLQRMGIGMGLSVVAMVVSAVVEKRRREVAVGAVAFLAVLGLSEAFNQVSQMEFYYKQFPESMRSVAGSLLFSGLALSIVVAVERLTRGDGDGDDGWLAEDLNRGRLDLFYLLVAAIGVANFLVFLACAKWYRYKGSDDDEHGNDR
uniref:Major facilitator superfamily (MFS) profile domain-containing protein n=1 Tax=Leersia perrieri TaxID=77586 RepID=A0A0D9WWE2_9ORYZ